VVLKHHIPVTGWRSAVEVADDGEEAARAIGVIQHGDAHRV
jgi:hypothetical protein